MTILPIILSPDPLLKQISSPVAAITEDTKRLIEDMFDTMYASNGVGLAAVQVGVLQRIIVVDTEWDSPRYAIQKPANEVKRTGNPIALINPEIMSFSDNKRSYDEGCLSFPAQYAEVVRPDTIIVSYTDIDGNQQQLHAEGLLSTCLQHEVDHMNGIVFVDHISRLKRDMIARKLKKAQKAEEKQL
jgi:peptide deformylase